MSGSESWGQPKPRLAPPGPACHLLAPPGASWPRLALPSPSLAPPGPTWRLLAPVWRLLSPPGPAWRFLAPPGAPLPADWLVVGPVECCPHPCLSVHQRNLDSASHLRPCYLVLLSFGPTSKKIRPPSWLDGF